MVKKIIDLEQIRQHDLGRKDVVTNRSILRRVIDSVLFHGNQGLAFRAYRELFNDDSINIRNFIELLKCLS